MSITTLVSPTGAKFPPPYISETDADVPFKLILVSLTVPLLFEPPYTDVTVPDVTITLDISNPAEFPPPYTLVTVPPEMLTFDVPLLA